MSFFSFFFRRQEPAPLEVVPAPRADISHAEFHEALFQICYASKTFQDIALKTDNAEDKALILQLQQPYDKAIKTLTDYGIDRIVTRDTSEVWS